MTMTKNKLRRVATASMVGAFTIGLASCRGAVDNHGTIDMEKTYASVGDFSVTYGDIWNELKWTSHEVLEEQITNVVLTKYINNIDVVLNKTASDLTDDEKKNLGFDENNEFNEEKFKKVKDSYEKRIVDYVVQDIYNFTYEQNNYWDKFKDLKHSDIDLLEAKYVDELYNNYLVDTFKDGTKISSAIKNSTYKDYDDLFDTYLKLGKEFSQIYYPLYAKELLAVSKLKEDVDKALEDDTDPDDTQWGYYTSSKYVDKFKSEYTNNFDLNAVIINFANTDELESTLRAFGLKLNSDKLYFIHDSKDSKYELVSGAMHYEDYIDYYNTFKTSDLGNTTDDNGNQISTIVNPNAVLEIYIQIYNYLYGGFKEKLSSNFNFTTDVTQLNNLRKLTKEILDKYSSPEGDKTTEDLLEDAKATLKANNNDQTYFSKEDLKDKYGDTFATYMYEQLTLDSSDTCFSTSSQSTNLGTTLAYKIDEYTDYKDSEKVEDETLVYFANWYKEEDRSSYDIIDLIKNTDKYPTLMDDLLALLMQDDITSTKISTYLSDEIKETKVKIYNEACEISYAAKNTDYSKTISGNSNSNVLATIEYDGTVYNLNIKSDNEDSSSIKVPGKNEGFGVFDYLNTKSGTTVAVNLLSSQIVKTTSEYEKTNKDRSSYEKYIENILYAFSNDAYSSNGYPSTIGKYNFLMLYFHTPDIDKIIDDYYRVQSAQGFLLTDYSSDKVINFMKRYTDLATENYFSLGGTRLVVYLDLDDDGKADDVNDWADLQVKEFNDNTEYFVSKKANITFGEVAKLLVQDIYTKISDSTDSHSNKLLAIVEEFNKTAKVDYEDNEISSEKSWAKYRHLGFIVTTEDFTVTNSSLDVDFDLKQRLFDYARGYSEDTNGNVTAKYQYFINNSVPTCYIEPLNVTLENVADDKTIIKTNDGYNLILVTEGTPNSSAKFEKKDNKEGILENIIVLYNDKPIKISDVYNDTDILNANQIKLYILDYALNGASTLSPASTSGAISTYLEPVVKRFAAEETQRIILLNYIAKKTNKSGELYDVITFAEEGLNGSNGIFDKLITMYRRSADEYIDIYNDTTKTSQIFDYEENGNTITWWDSIQNLLKEEA